MMWLILTITALVAFYIYKLRTINYWKDFGIPYIRPYPFIGNMGKFLLNPKSLIDYMSQLYKNFPNAKYVGYMNFSIPYLLLKDPEIIKMVTIKDFDHFINHSDVVPEDVDPVFGKTLLLLKDQKWKDMRSTINPSFSSSKMRKMFFLIEECGEQFVNYFRNKIKTQNNEPIIIEAKDVFSKFTNDVIASTAFGVKVNSLEQPKNEFYITGKKFFEHSITQILAFIGYGICPKLMKKLKISFFSSSASSFFKHLILDTIQVREKENIIRPDMIHLLMEAKKGQLRHDNESEIERNVSDTGLATVEESNVGKNPRADKIPLSDEDIAAQAFIFFGAGFDTSSTTMCFTAHELALNPDIQTRLQAEIDEVLKNNNGKLTYEIVNSMKYLDMIISETLRKWPSITLLDRFCGKKCTFPGPYSEDNIEKSITIDAGTGIWIPVQAIHHDPKYYSDPDKFDPERFNDENKRKIIPFTYLPFGAGPRACIGLRFALMTIKIALIYILSEFEFAVCGKTKIPLKIYQTTFILKAKDGFWLELRPRTTTEFKRK